MMMQAAQLSSHILAQVPLQPCQETCAAEQLESVNVLNMPGMFCLHRLCMQSTLNT